MLNIKKLEQEYPLSFEEFKKLKRNEFRNVNSAIDNLLFSFGIGVITVPVLSENEKLLGYKTKIRIYPTNSLELISEDIDFIEEFKKYKSPKRAEEATVEEAVKLLERNLIARR